MLTRFVPLLMASVALPVPSNAQLSDVQCDDSARLTHTLSNVLGAERQGMGLRDPETLLEIWITRKSGDWIIVQNYSNGRSCIVATGEHWEATGPAEPA